MKCRLSAKNVAKINRATGKSYVNIYARGGWGSDLEAWLDNHNADHILRRGREILETRPSIRDGQFIKKDTSALEAQVLQQLRAEIRARGL